MRRILICTVTLAAVAGPAAAAPEPKPSKPGAYKCMPKKVGYNARGALVSSDLAQTQGADTAKRGDDRYSGTITVDVKKANHKGQKGEQTYTLDKARVHVRPKGAEPKAGDRVKVTGKITRLGKKCDKSGFTATVTVRKLNVKPAKSS